MTQTATITRHDNCSELGVTVVNEANCVDMVLTYAYDNVPTTLDIVRWTDELLPVQEMKLSVAEGQQLQRWLSELDASGQLQAQPFYHEPIKNAVHLDGTPLPAPFGMVAVEKSDFTEWHSWDFCSDRSLLISNFSAPDASMVLDQAETLQLLGCLQQVYARVHQEQ